MPAMQPSERALCTGRMYRALARRIVLPWALQGLQVDGGEALEVGAGSGAMAAALLAGSPSLRMVVTDVDPQMLDVASRTLRPFANRVQVVEADAAALPFDVDRFDAVFSFAMLHHVVQWEAAVSELFRVLRPDGRLTGYDLADTRLMRAVSHHDSAEVRLATPRALLQVLTGLPFSSVSIRRSLGGSVMRFTATKAG